MGDRLYGLDWLRIGAFALLILYHVGMFFVPWDWHVKTPDPVDWAVYPMLASSPWRLSLLFLVSGTASAFLLAKSTRGGFARSRTARLFVPLVFGMAFVVPPQPWIELVTQHGYAKGFADFWTQDYFRFRAIDGIDLPTWNHLWFVAYLWVYSLLLAALAALLPAGARAAILRAGERVLGGWRILAVPLVLLWLLRVTLFPVFGETHGLLDDWYNHASYLLVFAIGLLLAHSPKVRADFVAWRRPALAAAAIGYAGYALYYFAFPEGAPEPSLAVSTIGRLSRTGLAWGGIVALVGFALKWSPADSPARRYLTEAVFPFYIAHQTIIVVAAWWLLPYRLGNATMFAILVATTTAGCALFYALARRAGPLRPLFGLKGPPG